MKKYKKCTDIKEALTIHGQHHTRADIDSLYVLIIKEGKGLMQIEGA
jgi:hypothetical protein